MAETNDTLNGSQETQQDTGIAQAQITPLPQGDMSQAQLEPTTVLQVEQPELPPDWATKLQADVTALRQVARSQAKPPAWFKQAVAKLPKEAAKQINLAAQLRQLEQQTQKARDMQTQAIVTAITRNVMAVGKGLAVQFGTQLKEIDRRIKVVEKVLGQMQRKMK